METLRQLIEVKGDRKVELTSPSTIQPGWVEMVVIVQPIPQTHLEPTSPSINLFSFLPRRIDPLQFQRQLRDERN